MQGLLDSLVEEEPVSVLIVDNASTPQTFEALCQIQDPRVQLLRSKKNLGFTGGINYALHYAAETMPAIKYFFLLNPDAFSCPNLITNLKRILEANGDAACVSPQVVHLNGDPWYAGALINHSEGKVLNIPDRQLAAQTHYYEVDVFSGCAALFDCNKVMKAGLFNEALFMYYDEADFSMRLRKLGYKILYAPGYKLFHDVSYTTKHISHLKTYYMTRNKFIVFGNGMNTAHKIYFLAHELAFHLKNGRFKNAYYHLRGYVDYKKGKSGPLLNV